MRRWRSLAYAGVLALFAGATGFMATQHGTITGVAFDSLAGKPLAGALVWLPAGERRTVTDGMGRFRLDSVPAGRHVVALTHPELESVGLSTLTAAATVPPDASTEVTLAVPGLTTFWRESCRDTLGTRSERGIVFGSVNDATGGLLAGAGVLGTWVQLIQPARRNVVVDHREARAHTDSLGAYRLCGVALDVPVRIRGYARDDSTGGIDVRVGPRGVARRDLTISLSSGAQGRTAALRGVVRTNDGEPLARARVIVYEARSAFTDGGGRFLLSGLPGGTQWVSVQAIGREPLEQAIVFRDGDTASLDASLAPLPVVLEPVSVETTRGTRLLADFERRRGAGWGYARTEDDIKKMGSIRGVLSSIPSVRFTPRARSVFDLTVWLPKGARGLCIAPLFIDGERASYEQLRAYRTADLVGVEVYPRASGVPAEFQAGIADCGVVLVWTKYLR